jgi:hypothetical protein
MVCEEPDDLKDKVASCSLRVVMVAKNLESWV